MATPQSIRYYNEVQVLDTLLRSGAMSRAGLARQVGLNRSSMGNIIAGLMDGGLVRERTDGTANGQVGRPGIAVEINPQGGAFAGIEIGVERLAACVVDLNGTLIGSHSLPHASARVPVRATLDAMARLMDDTLNRLDVRTPLRGMGVALPALLDEAGNVLNGQVLRWRNVPLRQLLMEQFADRFPVAVENDANAFAIAETEHNPALLSGTVAFLMMENGVGGSIFHHGKLFRGGHGHAGEFGHLLVHGKRPPPGDSLPHHLESHVGKDAVLAQYRAAKRQTKVTLDELFAAIDCLEPAALKTARKWGRHMASALTQISYVLNPRQIILGGAVAPLFTAVSNDINAAMHCELIDGFTRPEIRLSALGANSTLLGAALMMHRRFFSFNEQFLSKTRLSATPA